MMVLCEGMVSCSRWCCASSCVVLVVSPSVVRRLACFEGVLRASFALELSALLQFLCTSAVRYGRPLLKRHPNGKLAGGMTQIHADCPAFYWC